MPLSSRLEQNLNLGPLPQLNPNQPRSVSSSAANSPIEPPTGTTSKGLFGNTSGLGAMSGVSGNLRMGAGSPSHEYGSRLFSKRAREIQAQEGLGAQIWNGPPTSGNSTPLRETIPESPDTDSFPAFEQPTEQPLLTQTTTRRARAGTLPSRFGPAGGLGGLGSNTLAVPKTSRPTPSTSPFKPGVIGPADLAGLGSNADPAAKSALLSRLRAGSMPQPPGLIGKSTPFGPSVFSTNWSSTRDRASTLASIPSQPSNGPSSPAQSAFSRDGLADTDVKTLAYLGLADTPQQPRAGLAPSDIQMLMEQQQAASIQPTMFDLAQQAKNSNSRFRSYSVNAKEKYAEDDDDYEDMYQYSGTLTPSEQQAAAAYLMHEAVRQHNLEVQAFANLASSTRPRARTAGVLDSPSSRLMRSFLPTHSRLDTSMTADDLVQQAADYSTLTEAVQSMHLNGVNGKAAEGADETGLEGPTRALWLGNIPSSTTSSSLDVIFANFGPIESSRVLTHKNCGFVNFVNMESAVQAKLQLNGKEIFPGAGPIRIGYAKVPSQTGTPSGNGIYPSPSPDPTSKIHDGQPQPAQAGSSIRGQSVPPAAAPMVTPELPNIRDEIVAIVKEFGATDDEQSRIAAHIDFTISLDSVASEIPPIPEPSHNRMHDAPKLRDIRKRIDNNSISQMEIENIAMDMLPEIAELSSDYLGNTVVQKLFEFCSEQVKEAMLGEIAPHLAEIGIHKNGTWAAQKIIDVARTPDQLNLIVNALRPYGVQLFLDQYGNYVMQCCLRFGAPMNNFIFEVMLSQLWEVAQGRFGARAMRACLESHHATKDQQRMLAAAIALHSVQLATNANGALLLTWFLDTCTFPRRRTVLAPRLVPHLVHLCTHKVAYLTVLKIINQRNEPEARDIVLKALFFSPNDQVLEQILSDQACGSTLIFKILTTPFFDEKLRPDVVENVRNVLVRIKAQPAQGYKRLMDEVGLSSRSGGPVHHRDHGDGARGGKQAPANEQFNQYGAFPPQQQFDPHMNLQRASSLDSSNFDQQYPVSATGMKAPGFPVQNPMTPMTPLTPQQLQYQQALLANATARQPNFYPVMNGMPPGMAMPVGYQTATPPLDAFRNSPVSAGAQGYPTMMNAPQGFGYNGMGYMTPPPTGQIGQQGGSGGRRRVSSLSHYTRELLGFVEDRKRREQGQIENL